MSREPVSACLLVVQPDDVAVSLGDWGRPLFEGLTPLTGETCDLGGRVNALVVQQVSGRLRVKGFAHPTP